MRVPEGELDRVRAVMGNVDGRLVQPSEVSAEHVAVAQSTLRGRPLQVNAVEDLRPSGEVILTLTRA